MNCKNFYCGDGQQHAVDEACDDGNDITTDGCVNCEFAKCGDGFTQANIE